MENSTLKQYEKRFNSLRQKIDKHIASGGSIYETKRQLPYYEQMRGLIRAIKETTDPNFTKVDAYRICGFNYDPEYHEYVNFIRDLSLYADPNNYVDQIKKLHGSHSIRTQLKKLATNIGCSSADYLLLMTNYSYETIIVGTDYIAQLGKELKQAYPTGNATNIRRENPALYEKLRHVCKYCPEIGHDMQSVAEYFGLYNDRFRDVSVYSKLQEHAIIKKIRSIYPDGCIDTLSKDNITLYHQMARCANSHNQTIPEWAQNNGFTYHNAINSSKLSKTRIDADARKRHIEALKKSYAITNPPNFTNDREEYYYNKKIAQLIAKDLISTM